MNIKLRDYQIEGVEEIIKTFENSRSILFQMPTGTGKTTLFCELVRIFTTEKFPLKKVLIVTHRKELVEQVFERLSTDFGISSGIIAASYMGISSSQVQVASIQTLVRRQEHHKDIFSLVIIDEAHHALANTYKKLWELYPGSKILGVTATPVRTNGAGFQDLFDKLITSNSIKWFIEHKYLSDVRYYATHSPDLSNIKIKAGDYDETELSEVMEDGAVMADLVESYKEFALNKKIIVFAVNRSHSNKIVEKFNSSGFIAKSIDTNTPSDERKRIIEDFRKNKFKILCNVNIFTEGFDCPDVDAVQLARPTKSLTLFIQQIGRCMRPHTNKANGIVLDNAGLWKEHGLPKMERNWRLEGIDKNDPKSNLLGITEKVGQEISEPQESRAIRLIEVGDLENQQLYNVIRFHDIDKNLTDKKIITMRERTEDLIKKIEKFELLKSNETDIEDKKNLEAIINKYSSELNDLQAELQPKRFEQMLNIMKEKCQAIIEENEIFVEGDKDIFLQNFVEPFLKSEILIRRRQIFHMNKKPQIESVVNSKDIIEIFHFFPRVNETAKAHFNFGSKKISYKGVDNLSPSSAAAKANADKTGKITSLNGWIFWKHLDANGNEITIENLK